jgi:hypothetical protein
VENAREIMQWMNLRCSVLVIGILAAFAGCSRHEEAPKVFGATQTHNYLLKVGQIRAVVNADNKERIPGMIRGQDVALLDAQAAKTEGYMHSLEAIDTNGVDPEALKFAHNFAEILGAYKSVSLDLAELFREMKTANARLPAPSPPANPLLGIKFGPEPPQGDTIGAVDVLLQSISRMDTTAKAGGPFFQPMVNRVRDDREKLRSSKVAHHEFAQTLKAELAKRYGGLDWTSKELLP